MSDQNVEVRNVVWKEVFPWLILPRVFAVAISPAVLVCALLALVGSAAGWRVASMLVVEDRETVDGEVEIELYDDLGMTDERDVEYVCDWPTGEYKVAARVAERPVVQMTVGSHGPEDPVTSVAGRYLYPWMQLLAPAGDPENGGRTWKEFTFYLFGGLWSLLVWAVFAGAITRMAALRLSRDERLGFMRATTYSCRRLSQYFAAPLLPLLGVLLLAILPALCGLLMRFSFFAAVGGVLWFLALLFGLFITLLLIGVIFGWPLMWPAISAEGRNGDAFDAFSRSYNYTFARPLHYLFYVMVAAFIGILGWIVVGLVAEGVIYLSYWAVSLGSGGAQINALASAAAGQELESGMLEFGGEAIGFWVGLVHAVANAFAYAYFWCAMTAIYLLLRRDVDQAEIEAVESMDEMPISPLPSLDAQRPDPRGR